MWVEKTRHTQKPAISKRSTLFVQSSWNLVKMIASIIFTKFPEDRTKNVYFLLMIIFWACIVFSYSDLIYMLWGLLVLLVLMFISSCLNNIITLSILRLCIACLQAMGTAFSLLPGMSRTNPYLTIDDRYNITSRGVPAIVNYPPC